MSVLAIAGGDLASTEWERDCMTWLSERDQGIFGSGMAGFDLNDIAWDPLHLSEQKSFLFKVIDSALAKHGWDRLNYAPPRVHEDLQQLRVMVAAFEPAPEHLKDWDWSFEPTSHLKCPVHGAYLHALNAAPSECCPVCNDDGSAAWTDTEQVHIAERRQRRPTEDFN